MKKIISSLSTLIINILKRKVTVKKLRKWGAVVGEDVELINISCGRKDATCLEIGNHVTLSYVEILTHDSCGQRFLGNKINRIGRVVIGNNVFIGRQTIILPNCKIGNNVIIGAGSIVTKNIPDNSVAAGNPCKVICSIEDWIQRQYENMENNTFWNVSRSLLSKEELKFFNNKIDGRIVYFGKR